MTQGNLTMKRNLLYKYRVTANIAAKNYIGDSPHFLLNELLRLIRVALMLSLWRILLAGRPEGVDGMTLSTLLTYTLVAELFAEQMAAQTGIEDLIWNGTILTRFLQPMPLVGVLSAEMVGRWRVGFWLVTIPLLLLCPLFGVSPLPASLTAGVLFTVSLALAIIVGLALDTIFASFMIVWGGNIWILSDLRNAVATLLTGAFLPYALLPYGIGKVFAWLPFAAMASAPLQIFTGTGGNSLQLLVLQLFWAVTLTFTAVKVWSFSRERIVGQGG